MSNLPQYTFLSWYRQGMSVFLETPDSNSATDTAIPELTFGVKLEDQDGNMEQIQQAMPLAGPQNIKGIRPQAVIQTFPLAGAATHPASYLAAIEFYDEDFPWRYTPAAPSADAIPKLRPWICLLVLEDEEFSISHQSDRPLPFITLDTTLADGTTPNLTLEIPPEQAWAWAHVQLNKKINSTHPQDFKSKVKTELENNPSIAFSRIICPRKLKPSTHYTAFLIPYFEKGRLEGLGQDSSAAALLQASWAINDLASDPKQFPFYYHWEFTTSEAGDFETLARKLQAQELTNLPLLQVNATPVRNYFFEALSANDATPVMELESVLMPAGQTATPWPHSNSTADAEIQTAIETQLNPVTDTQLANLQEDIVVGKPPVYGQWHLGASDWQGLNNNLDKTQIAWIHQLNTNIQARALAGIGTKVVKEHQETFMAAAWAQIGEVMEANQQINQSLLARETSNRLYQKHLLSSQHDTVLALTGSIQNKMVHDDGTTAHTVFSKLQNSNLSVAPVNSGFTKLRRPESKQQKKLRRLALQNLLPTATIDLNAQFISGINAITNPELNGEPPKPGPYKVLNASNVSGNGFTSPQEVSDLVTHVQSLGGPLPLAADLTAEQDVIKQGVNPLFTIQSQSLEQLALPNSPSTEGPLLELPGEQDYRPIMAAPIINKPLYEYVKTITQRFILPDVATLGDNFVGVMNVNQAVIEQIMVGANHEMGRELLWRGYPTDQRGTYFKQFWNVKDHLQTGQGAIPYEDIKPVHLWGAAAPFGNNRPAAYPSIPLVLVVKGELVRAHPDLVIYAHKAIANPQLGSNPNAKPTKILDPTIDNTTVKYPIFRAELAPDVVALGFDLDQNAAISNEGWYFIFKERPGKVKLGLDDNAAAPVLNGSNWNDLDWGHLTSNYVDVLADLNSNNAGSSLNLADSAAQVATRLYQAPLMLGIHASRLLP